MPDPESHDDDRWNDTTDPTGQIRFFKARRAEGMSLRDAKARWAAEHSQDPQAQPAVGDMLVAEVDALVAYATALLDEVRAVTEQLEPERARACRTAIILARTGVDEIRLRAHARPLDEPEP